MTSEKINLIIPQNAVNEEHFENEPLSIDLIVYNFCISIFLINLLIWKLIIKEAECKINRSPTLKICFIPFAAILPKFNFVLILNDKYFH